MWVAAAVKTAPQSAKIAEKTVRSVMMLFVRVAEYVTNARAVKEISVMVAICAAVVR